MKPPRANRYRSAWAGDLRAEQDGQETRVAGWVHRRRDHGGLIFIDLRDRTGLLQVVFHPESAPDAHRAAHDLRAEDVISVAGRVARREEGTVNPNLPTGEIELKVAELDLLADADTPPFQIDDPGTVAEEMRLRYRYLDLRRDRMREALELRHHVVAAIRDFLREEDFLDIETPMLTRSTPEGARDYLVPSRVQRGSWYALPQSPQLFKQLFMVAGLERYYQIVRCFRDEDPRADRQPEFTQLDMELSFVEEEDVITLIDRLLERVLAVAGIPLETPLDRLAYDDAMLRYGTDRPDRRPGMEIQDLSSVFAGSEFKAFAGVIGDGGVVRGLKAPAGEWPRKRFDDLTEKAKSLGAKGLVWAVVEEGGSWRSPIAKFLSPDEMAGAARDLEAGEGDVLLLVADQAKVAARVLGELRLELAGPQEGHDLLWVVDFPMFEQGDAGLDPLHHPFTSPSGDLDADPLTWRSRAYDVIMDGWELGGGSIRISDIDVQRRVFDAIGLTPEQANERFGFLLEAFRYGAPPHGGIAFGLDRIVALLAGRDSIRDVIAFPKTSTAQDLLTGAPAPAEEAQLKELGVSVQKPPGQPGGPPAAGA